MRQEERLVEDYQEPTNTAISRFDFFNNPSFLQLEKAIYEKRLKDKAMKKNLKEAAMVAAFIFGYAVSCIFFTNADFDVFRFINTLPQYVVYLLVTFGWLGAWIDRKRRLHDWNIKLAAGNGQIYNGCRIKEYSAFGETNYHFIELDPQTLSRLQIEKHRQAIYDIEAELRSKAQAGMQFEK